ncbi:synaptotagmin-5-like [Liolophura sinensis]|uniref:synaptotagmin-5-like n=1 Tax=Liolophura sinensis TaxID=3198878 RepID=UPI0031590B8F
MAYEDTLNCTASVCPTQDGLEVIVGPSSQVLQHPKSSLHLVIALCILFSSVVAVSMCLYWGRGRFMRILTKRKMSRSENREMINFVVPNIRVTEVYVTRPSGKKFHKNFAKEKSPANRLTTVSSLSVDGALSDTSLNAYVSDEDREHTQARHSHTYTRSLSRSHGDLLDGSDTLSVTASWEDTGRRYTMERFDIRPSELNTAQYTQSACSLDSSASVSSCELGKICFSVAYNDRTEVLTVIIKKVVNLSPRPARVFADPYVKLTLLPDKTLKYVTTVHQRTLEPVFCQTFLFPVKRDELESKALKLTVCDHLKFFRRNVLGYTVYALRELGYPLVFGTHYEIWRSLTEDLPFKGTASSQGEILVGIKLDQLCHAFTVSVLQVKDILVSDDEREHGGIRVKVTIMVGQQVVKTKISKQRKYPKENLVAFNQNIRVRMPQLYDCINRLNVSVSVFVDHTFFKSRLIGRTCIGPYSYASDSGLRHWINMLTSPSEPNIMWHKLT